MKKPAYDAELRESAVRIVIETGKPVGDVAEELGINPGTLHSLKTVPADRITMATMPTAVDPQNPDHLVPTSK
ncbi:transposase, partial [Streptomyces flaveolus]|uniref:transposase n=1 Tax=Streptomyces flaveolus TaxID=67297 RepID=UPI0033CB5257